jgi:hypothetical protein
MRKLLMYNLWNEILELKQAGSNIKTIGFKYYGI